MSAMNAAVWLIWKAQNEKPKSVPVAPVAETGATPVPSTSPRQLENGASVTRPKLLDLFCGAGGAAMGYHRAGFDVVGVDINPQPHYPFEFMQADALDWLRNFDPLDIGPRFAAIHASPPCQWGTAYRRRPGHVAPQENLVPDVLRLLRLQSLPWIVEQPESNRAALSTPITLCGSSFGLDVRRHRCFESNIALLSLSCQHDWQTPRFPPATNRTNLRKTVEVGVWRIPLDVQKQAMDIDWDMTLHELSESIPPPYTHRIGQQLIGQLL